MGELTFFLGFQVKQKQDGVFISQDKYIAEILKKYGFSEVKNASTPMETQKPLLKDEDGEEVDVYMYKLMTGSLMYLTSSRPDIMSVVCACARYQVNLNVSHLHVVKMIFSGGIHFQQVSIGVTHLLVEEEVEFWATAKSKTINGEAQIHAKVDGKKVIISKVTIKKDLQFGDEGGVDCLPTEPTESEGFEQIINFLNAHSIKYTLMVNPTIYTLCIEQFWATAKSKTINGEAQIHAKNMVIDLETTKITQALEIDSLKRRGRIADLDAEEGITLVNETAQDQGRINDEEMFDTDVTNDEEVFDESLDVAEQAKEIIADKDIINDITLAKALMEIKSTKPKADKVVTIESE
nr:hypothetical protein [Tanacetum cinerariifolium]